MMSPPVNSTIFRLLCRVLGGQDPEAFDECIAAGRLPQLFAMAYEQDVLPALAIRHSGRPIDRHCLGEEKTRLLKQALMENTLHNMSIKAQALKITRQLNQAGVVPVVLKGTARLLTMPSEHLGFRKQADIDLLVEPSQLKVAGDVFLADGYHFQLDAGAAAGPKVLADTGIDTNRAMKISAAHRHLPALVKDGCATAVELHRHHLPKRWQRNNPLEPLLRNAVQFEVLGATFLVPCTEHQIIHLILGKLVSDGHFTRRSFPIREACDLIDLLDSAGERVDQAMLEKHCGTKFALFHALVVELMAYRSPISINNSHNTSRYVRMMQRRFNSRFVRFSLDAAARVEHLSHQLAYSPARLPDYLRRVMSV